LDISFAGVGDILLSLRKLFSPFFLPSASSAHDSSYNKFSSNARK